MADGRMKQAWDHTAVLAAEIHNCLCTKKVNWKTYHPYLRKPPRRLRPGETGRLLQEAFS